ncbi:centromere protein K-like [Amphiura filiformis]|uniref:centromere protein K-like n=1 Tax=Amphiura filiformis TaxID=82378 RepID=UPI003B216654
MMDEEEVILSPNLSQTRQAETELRNECETLWVQVNKIHERVNSEPTLGVLGDTEQPMLQILQAKSKRLEAEVHTLDAKEPQALPTNPTILKALLQKELSKSNQELEQTLAFIQAQRKELEEDLTREKGVLEQHYEVKRTLQSKLEAAEDGTETSRSSQEKELHQQRKSAAEHQKKLMRNLAAFVSKHFPKPTEKTKQTADREHRSKEYMSLLEILEILMNKCMDSESDPYVAVDETCWPPYIELLLRCGIALRHPQDYKRIRLVPFHL